MNNVTHNANDVMYTTHNAHDMMHATHMQCMQCGIMHRIMCIASCVSPAGEMLRKKKNKHPGNFSTSENVTYSESEKCWKFLNILITSLAQNMLRIVKSPNTLHLNIFVIHSVSLISSCLLSNLTLWLCQQHCPHRLEC